MYPVGRRVLGMIRENGSTTGSALSDRAGHLIGLQALGAYVKALGGPIDQSANALNIRIPAAVGANVRVRHALAEAGSLTAHVTNGSHDDLLGFQFSCDPALRRDARHAMRVTAGNYGRIPDRRACLQVFFLLATVGSHTSNALFPSFL